MIGNLIYAGVVCISADRFSHKVDIIFVLPVTSGL